MYMYSGLLNCLYMYITIITQRKHTSTLRILYNLIRGVPLIEWPRVNQIMEKKPWTVISIWVKLDFKSTTLWYDMHIQSLVNYTRKVSVNNLQILFQSEQHLFLLIMYQYM